MLTIQEKITAALEIKGIKPSEMLRTLGVPKSTFSLFMNKNSTIPSKHLLSIMDYLNMIK